MARGTKISWCTSTWNPWRGCTKVTKACDHCYMFRDQRRYGRDPEIVVRAAPATFNSPLKWDDPELVFTCSWSDWFHIDADPWRNEAWDIIRRTPQHTYMILTKRPGRIHRCLPADWGEGWPNVWLGVSIEDAAVLHRADQLRKIPAALRFISAEPLLGTLYSKNAAIPDESRVDQPQGLALAAREGSAPTRERAALDLAGIGLVIVGGESGSRADIRPMHPEWAREIRNACILGHPGPPPYMGAGIMADPDAFAAARATRPAFHFKQWGGWAPAGRGVYPNDICLSEDGTFDTAGPDYVCFANESDGEHMRYMGGGPDAGGKLLDGIEWCELPDWQKGND